MRLLQLLPTTCLLVARHVINTLAASALVPAVPYPADQTDFKPPPAVPGAGEGLQGVKDPFSSWILDAMWHTGSVATS